MADAWATVGDIQDDQLPDAADFLAGVSDQDAYLTTKIENATDEAKSYLMRYHHFFSGWTATTVPRKLRDAVVTIAVHYVTSRNTKLALTTQEKTTWERNYDRAIAWLKDLQAGRADLDVEWPMATDATSGHRASFGGTRRPELG
jgi:phage gp36-like protein